MRELDEIHEYCMSKKEVSEDFPFDEHTLVFKVVDKVFLLVNLQKTPTYINLKCDPELAVELRSRYPSVKPGYHMNKRHWNSVTLEGRFSDEELRDWIDMSYRLVAKNLKKADRVRLGVD